MRRTQRPLVQRGNSREPLIRSVIRSTSKFVLAALLSFAVPALAASPASVGGVVQDGDHAPLMGAVVELFGAEAFPLLTAFTDIRGHYQFSNVAPGRYKVRVLQVSSIPAPAQKVQVEASTHAVVNLTLMSIFSVSQWFPASGRAADESADEWQWTLRSGVDRPILRWIEPSDGTNPESDDSTAPHNFAYSLRGHAALTGGSRQFGEGGFRQEALLRMDEHHADEAVLHIQTSTTGAAFVGGGIERNTGLEDTARLVATYRTLPINYGARSGRLQILQIRGGEQLALSDELVAQFGAETEVVQAGQTATAALPFMAVHLQADGNEISYRLATASDLQDLQDLAASGEVPAMTMQNANLRITRALHQEFSVDRNVAGLQLEAAYFYDHLVDPVLNGYGDGSAAQFSSGNVLLDPMTGAFRSAGPNYAGGGFRVFASRQVRGNLWTAVEYAEGPAIELPAANFLAGNTFADALAGVVRIRTQAVLFSMHGHVHGPGTRWNAGYRWQPEATLTAVDPFNTGMNAPFLSVSLHQPLGAANSSPDRLELEFMMQNMLAQGYRPIYIVAGQTLYFAQTPRLVAGGLAFSF